MKRWQKPRDPIQHEDPTFDYNIEEDDQSSSDNVYEDDTTGKAHKMTEVDDIQDFDMYIHSEVLLHKMESIYKLQKQLAGVLAAKVWR